MNSITYILNYLSIEYGILKYADSAGIINTNDLDLFEYYYYLEDENSFQVVLGHRDRNTLFKNILYIQTNK